MTLRTYTPSDPDMPSGRVFSLNPMTSRTPTITHQGNTTMLTRAELDHASCPACYRPVPASGYCSRCLASGAAHRHRSNPHRQPLVEAESVA